MDKIREITSKIIELKRKREDLQLKQAQAFYTQAQKVLKGQFSAELALAIIESCWTTKTDAQEKAWQAQAKTFFRSPKNKQNPKPRGAKNDSEPQN